MFNYRNSFKDEIKVKLLQNDYLQINMIDSNDIDEYSKNIHFDQFFSNLIDKKEDETLDLEEKRKKLENESIFENKMIINNKKTNLNNSIRSTTTTTSTSSSKLSNLRKKLTKSIQEKKLNEICNGNDSIKKDLLFTIKKKQLPNEDNTLDNTSKLSSLIRKVQESTVKIGLVSTDYGDDSSND